MSTVEKAIRIVLTMLIIFCMIFILRWRHQAGVVMAIFEIILLVIAAYASGPVIANILGIRAGTMFVGSKKHEEIPLLSEAESAVKRGEYEKAVEKYLNIQKEFPDYLPMYQSLLEVLFLKLHDSEQAREVYRTGWMAMNAEQRKRLEHLYKEFSGRAEKK